MRERYEAAMGAWPFTQRSLLAWVVVAATGIGCGSSGRDGFEGAQAVDPAGADGDFGPASSRDAGNAAPPSSCSDAAGKKSYAGCDFVISPVPYLQELSRPPCFALFLANHSTRPAKVKVSYAGQSFPNVSSYARLPNGSADPKSWPPLTAAGIPPKQVAVVYLSDDPTSTHITFQTLVACPGETVVHEPNGAAPPWPHRSTKTFHVETDEPVTAYDVMPFGGAKSFIPSAELLLPTSAWGKNYVLAIPPLALPPDPTLSITESAWTQIVAKDDDTKVTILGATSFEAPSLAEAVEGNVPKTLVLMAGEYIQWHAWRRPGLADDMSGSIISADKPVALIGGDTALRIATKDSIKVGPTTGTAAPRFCCVDSSHQQVPPISGLGFDYVAAPYATRRKDMAEESLLYRFVGVVDGTVLGFDPPIASAPSMLARGQVVDLEVQGAFRIKSQDKNHPFYVAQTMSYSTMAGDTRPDGDPTMPPNPNEGGPRSLGDPEFVNVLPPAQFIKEYSFVTDPTYATTNLVITRAKEAGGFKDVTIDCVGSVGGWQPVGTSGAYEWTRVDIVRGGKKNGTCQNGAHTAKSDGSFGITVWGMDWWASYAYPAGGSVYGINDVTVPAVPR